MTDHPRTELTNLLESCTLEELLELARAEIVKLRAIWEDYEYRPCRHPGWDAWGDEVENRPGERRWDSRKSPIKPRNFNL